MTIISRFLTNQITDSFRERELNMILEATDEFSRLEIK